VVRVEYNNDGIRVEVDDISKIASLPVKVEIIESIGGKVVFSREVTDNMWVTYPVGEMKDVIIRDVNGVKIFERKWNLMDGGRLYKCLYGYCHRMTLQNNKLRGLAVGTHDGAFGEWVPAVREKMSKAFLIEASNKQFNELCKNYKDFSNVKLYEKLITTDGKDIEFFEGGGDDEGYTNSVINEFFKKQNIKERYSRISPSTSLNEFIVKEMNSKIDWLHLDVEGYDAKLILSIDETLYNLPKLIIWEYEHIEEEEKISLEKFLYDRGYIVDYDNNNAMATKSLI
jgi:FkbM family methyltransferase